MLLSLTLLAASTTALSGVTRRQLGQGVIGGAAAPVKDAVAATPDEVFLPEPGSLKGKVVLITGANTGLGLESAKRLASGGATVIGTARSEAKAEALEAQVRDAVPDAEVRGVVVDLASLESIRSFPRLLDVDAIDVLMNNAGVMAIPERRSTVDGFERQIGVNFLGHFALTAVLLPLLKKRSTFRIINVSSSANFGASRGAMREALESPSLEPNEYSQWGTYCLSKAMNIMFSTELQRRLDDQKIKASVVSLHPGAVATDLARYLVGGADAASTKDAVASAGPFLEFFLKALSFAVLPVDRGANTQVFLAANADNAPNPDDFSLHGGLYYDSMKPTKPNDITRDPVLVATLWRRATELTGFTMM
ncbi:hypothetical protein CTAYLR_005022 [Chrysophaeum taylorii]|uniref:Short-chain dehydrogenase/reductase n=1 Tax=Chrysophaeum taylorii TaxID=2483200 RepID=A0AAD7UAV2_9STRA|nr:hypothetical protein CTAYLR_005022 [Chrysophaeum taylorii]